VAASGRQAAQAPRVRVEIAAPSGPADDALARALTALVAGADVSWRSRETPFCGDVVVVPPGIEADAELEDALRVFALAGGAVLGLGAGAALLCAAGLLPGRVVAAASDETHPRHVRVEGRASAFTWAIPAGRVVALAGESPRHLYAASDDELATLVAGGGVVLRYCDDAGGLDHAFTSRAARVAGVCDEAGRVVGVLAPLALGLDDALGRQLVGCFRSGA
jgi:hypothetical protein